jgi:hypothetical protein
LERPPNIGDGVDLSRPIVITRTTEIGAELPMQLQTNYAGSCPEAVTA